MLFRFTYFLLTFLITSCFISCVNDMEEVNATTQYAERDIEHGKKIEMYYSEEGNVKILIKAPVVTRYNTDNPYIEFNEGLHADFFDDNMQVTSQLTANYGVRYEKDLKTIVRNNVIVINEKNEQLHTEELTWDEKKHTIFTEKQVIIETATDTLRGTGLQADERMTHYKILKPLGTIQVETKNEIDSNATINEDL